MNWRHDIQTGLKQRGLSYREMSRPGCHMRSYATSFGFYFSFFSFYFSTPRGAVSSAA